MNENLVLALKKTLIDPLATRISLLVARGTVRQVGDGAELQRLQVEIFKDDPHSEVERFQNYGLSSVPLAGTEAIALSRGGSRTHLVVVAVDDRAHRPTGMKAGEVKLYDHLGQYVHFKEDGSWEFKAVAGGKMIAPAGIEIDAPFLHCTGEIKDRVNTGGKSMSEMRATFDEHDHSGVEPGGGTTNDPNQTMGGHGG